MTLETSASIMDTIFLSEDDEGKGWILKIMQEFLLSESSKDCLQGQGRILLCLLAVPPTSD